MITVKELQDMLVKNTTNEIIRFVLDQQLPTPSNKPIKPTTPGRQCTALEAEEWARQVKTYELEFETWMLEKERVNIFNRELITVLEEFLKIQSGLMQLLPSQITKVWNKAYQDGRSEGYYSVYYHLCELVDLF